MKFTVIDLEDGKELTHFDRKLQIVCKCAEKFILETKGECVWNNMSIEDKRRLIDNLFRYSVCDDNIIVGVNRG